MCCISKDMIFCRPDMAYIFVKIEKEKKMKDFGNDSDTRRLMRELRFTRMMCMVSSALTLCLLIGGVFLFGRLQELSQMCQPAIEKISDMDMESFNNTLHQVNATLGNVDWELLSENLGKLDVKALDSAVKGLNTEEFSEALKNLNDAVEKIKELGDRLSALPSWFSGQFGGGQ